ncbi:hypothetical protein SMACR_04302 [Sordaria macrospora]|uniref:C2H2 type master regulator of conidiophore development brlA n=2 Tax=Sordaria macrospora TaxID=5147 RepID=F7W1G0_SORMK|nr:putative conidial septation protein [Sordaria macrospora k-hell]KAA8635788.1 hypothetical protein SMACR_04302 [Sordaria macrospora]KAH7626471.1 putative conidial septation protein [Sordaria sp. MPI-SDFR-AT-0083]WPJ57980.1 hypothetical protein SMAC4_04302 [Sordaria macrospora]CCC04935.1 putative conidial septation protein [Sordaria macrospora k-hell]
MFARDANGHTVQLLNDDEPQKAPQVQYQPMPYRAPSSFGQPYHPTLTRSLSSSPNTPELLRSDSYDSQMSNEPISPMTPIYDYSRGYPIDTRHYEDHSDAHSYIGAKRPRTMSDSRSMSYEDDAASPAATERTGKRYPCRYRDSHGCEKTFTTSGHASRHSKIHTAEKAVPCSFQGCTKKFTRADNMKQHLETHYKDKSRSSTRPSLAGERKSSSSGKSSRSKSTTSVTTVASAASPAALPLTPGVGSAWDMRGLNLPLLSPSIGVPTPSSGLDALAMAVACQEGSS